MVLQQALADVTGQPFDALLQEAVLGPLQMHRSTFVSSPHAQTHTKLLWPAPFLPNSLSPICWAVQAQPLSPSLEHNAARAHPEVPGDDQAGEKWHVYPEQYAAGLWTTPTDLGRFLIEVQLSVAGRSNKVLSQTMAAKMVTTLPFVT